ncbi:PREDICTED: anomalous homeobox protein-like [Fulmarus glacialis]|uniref:anomalous homeobox protein-like n=1 Tax=Fulmarus glacialis TaxID=30455 RepID=UPI00051C11BA|nr:PREDICTED: anomalous homeobox protein-like [Fulmarus glacialis]
MKRFMAMLNRNKNKDPPPAKLLDLAGQLCQDVQSSFPSLEKLVGAMMGCKHKMHFLTNIHVVRACVFVHIHNGQHDTACRLLEYCKAEEKEELVQLWHEIHYRRVMEKHHTDFLTPLQKFRCRKRNPPPISLCPEGLKNRNYSGEVRQQLHRFAAEVTSNPNKKQREGLARDMNLQPTQVYNWFANYRRRQKSCLPRTEKLNNLCLERALTYHTKERQDKGSYTPQTADEQLDMCQAPSGTRAVSGSMWTPSIEVGLVPTVVHIHVKTPHSELLRRTQVWAFSCQMVYGKPQCPPVSAHCMEESQALGQSQVLEDPVGDPLTNDTFWAAWLLFEFSAGGRM